MDLIVHAPGVPTPIYSDVTIVDATSAEALASRSASREGAAAAVAAKGKRRKYPNITCTPFPIEVHGRLGRDAILLAKRLAPTEPAERSMAIRSLYQALSATVQRYQADAVIASLFRQLPSHNT